MIIHCIDKFIGPGSISVISAAGFNGDYFLFWPINGDSLIRGFSWALIGFSLFIPTLKPCFLPGFIHFATSFCALNFYFLVREQCLMLVCFVLVLFKNLIHDDSAGLLSFFRTEIDQLPVLNYRALMI